MKVVLFFICVLFLSANTNVQNKIWYGVADIQCGNTRHLCTGHMKASNYDEARLIFNKWLRADPELSKGYIIKNSYGVYELKESELLQ